MGEPVPPSGCRHCGVGEREHLQRWTAGVGWHFWVAPSARQRLERMLARRAARARPPT
ncbi:hypothetical protein Ssi03_25600 [Sphaerisporangium siamense]|uniref:Uncharacterized protein n=1 Tax=Sphaerisporangium siamense TaxID=795645 RepID=A0A7W7D6A0_9ACTN|nr:hypothetical protein [Sphaerisporangium siamense]MBB4700115.1 hypothetical protein [Sphaerisporangium siamense]GII84570.1 hypothetical protein Ssi03_25600 [Sphaerisporangium siamense]